MLVGYGTLPTAQPFAEPRPQGVDLASTFSPPHKACATCVHLPCVHLIDKSWHRLQSVLNEAECAVVADIALADHASSL
jgi:pyruvate/2-oxoacid:ferredoxin oxidoreductase beta subunit